MKKAETRTKELEAEKSKTPVGDQSDSLGLAKTVAALKDYSAEELDDIALIAKAKELSLEEATQSEEAKVLVAARREKVEKAKQALEPSTKVIASKKPIEDITPEEISKMGKEEKNDYLERAGWTVRPRTPKNRGGK